MPLPDEPFRVVGNIPFHRTTAILRRLLDDLDVPLRRADLIVQWEVAQKRAAVVPSTQLDRGVGAVVGARARAPVRRERLRAATGRRCGLLRIVRREHELVDAARAPQYRRFVSRAFAESLRSVVPPLTLKRAAAAAGFDRAARPRDLDAHQWSALFLSAAARRWWQPLMSKCNAGVTKRARAPLSSGKHAWPRRACPGGCHRDGHVTGM